jgi:uncharacterized repeat protein (TIGR02543 family)
MKKTISFLIVIFCCAGILYGCNLPQMVFETEHFSYIKYSNRSVVRSLTDKGKEAFELYIPSFLHEKPVTDVGEKNYAMLYYLQSDNLKHLNLPYTLERTTTFSGLPKLESLVSARTKPMHFGTTISPKFATGKIPTIYVPAGCVAAYEEKQKENSSERISFKEANISLMFNYENSPNDGFYFVDYRQKQQKIIRPIDPKRDDYIFNGWFEDEAGTILWDFENVIIEGKTLYASWTII